MPVVRAFDGLVPVIDPSCFLAETAVVVGDVVLGAGSSVWYGAVLRGDVMAIRIGERTSIQDNAVVHVTTGFSGTTIGNGVTVGHGAIIHACTIEDDCLIGMGAIILDGARVRRGSMVGAGALVPPHTDIPEGSRVLGVPAKIRGEVSEQERQWITSSAAQYVRLSERYLASEGQSSLR
ncbi:MAG: gamma carbonic anhydrase family protein [Myxococcales bacterium]|jgi:gamma-carbonic anhydrase|nr:gamma carbonic anhydrase family protein [Myxococcales bacterium]HRC58457.1 gamma carbonic anhydrase family protein [Kofleriaceae bacterium]